MPSKGGALLICEFSVGIELRRYTKDQEPGPGLKEHPNRFMGWYPSPTVENDAVAEVERWPAISVWSGQGGPLLAYVSRKRAGLCGFVVQEPRLPNACTWDVRTKHHRRLPEKYPGIKVMRRPAVYARAGSCIKEKEGTYVAVRSRISGPGVYRQSRRFHGRRQMPVRNRWSLWGTEPERTSTTERGSAGSVSAPVRPRARSDLSKISRRY